MLPSYSRRNGAGGAGTGGANALYDGFWSPSPAFPKEQETASMSMNDGADSQQALTPNPMLWDVGDVGSWQSIELSAFSPRDGKSEKDGKDTSQDTADISMANPLFFHQSAENRTAASMEDVTNELDVLLKHVDAMVEKMEPGEGSELEAKTDAALELWDNACLTHGKNSLLDGSENIQSLAASATELKILMNKIEQLTYMNISLPGGDKAALVKIIASIRSKVEPISVQAKKSMKRSSIIATVSNVKNRFMKGNAARSKLK